MTKNAKCAIQAAISGAGELASTLSLFVSLFCGQSDMSRANNVRGVIFDLDGVLVDTSAFHCRAWRDLAERHGYEFSGEFFRSTFGMQNYQILPLLAGRDLSVDEIERLSKWKENRYRRLVDGKPVPCEGVEHLIEELKGNGFLLAIGTSTPRANLDLMLAHLNVGGSFDAFVTGEDVSRGKPSPDTFLAAAEKLGLEPKRCAVVEDAVQGVEAGRNAGMAVVAVTSTRSREDLKQADLIVDRLAELDADRFIKLIDKGRADG